MPKYVSRSGGVVTGVFNWPNPKALEQLDENHPDIVGHYDAVEVKREAALEQHYKNIRENKTRVNGVRNGQASSK